MAYCNHHAENHKDGQDDSDGEAVESKAAARVTVPADSAAPAVAKKSPAGAAKDSSSRPARSAKKKAAPDDSREWQEYRDVNTKRCYYHCDETNETTWVRPTAGTVIPADEDEE